MDLGAERSLLVPAEQGVKVTRCVCITICQAVTQIVIGCRRQADVTAAFSRRFLKRVPRDRHIATARSAALRRPTLNFRMVCHFGRWMRRRCR